MGSQLFGPLSKDSDIRVGYIDGDNGFVEGLSVCEANEYARLNPGTVFIFKTGDKVLKYLNINEVNGLTTRDVIDNEGCAGINQKVKCGPPKIEITGGGGIGAVGNPVVGADGSILAVDVIRTGHGYAFEPQVTARDDCDYGSGTVLRAVLGELVIEGEELVIRSEGSVSYGLNFRNTGSIRGYRGGNETYLYQYYDRPDDYEEYFLCDDEVTPFGTIWGPRGENLGEWKPTVYIGGRDPIAREVQEFERDVRALEGGFFNTRKIRPSKISSSNPNVTGGWYHVDDGPFIKQQYGDKAPPSNAVRWGNFQNRYAISPKPPSNVPGSDFAGTLFTYEWNLDFPTTGEYKIRGTKDNRAKLYIDNKFISDLDGFKGSVNEIKKYYKEGAHTVKVELLNLPIYETKTIDAYERQVAGVDFIQKSNGIYMTVGGNADVEVALTFGYDDDPDNAGTAATEIRIPNSAGRPDLILKREREDGDWKENGSVTGKQTFARSEDGYGPIVFKGANKPPQLASKNKAYGEDSNKYGKINLFDKHGKDVNAYLTVSSTTNLQQQRPKKVEPGSDTQIINTEVFNTIDWIGKSNRQLWRTNPNGGGGFLSEYGICPFDTTQPDRDDNPYAGIHEIIWDNLDFPADGNYQIQVGVDDNVSVYIGNSENPEQLIEKRGFKPGTDNGTGDSTYTKFFKKGKYRLRALLEQIPGGRFGFSGIKGTNPMALAIRVTNSRAEVTAISPKSWNQNPMGVALTIDAPDPTVPQEPAPIQEGRCPPNPIWTTRTSGAKEQWYPVTHSYPGGKKSWSKFTNRYAISPVKPLAQPNTDAGGTTFKNSWTVEIPFDGYYGLKATADNGGRVLIDGVEQLSGGLGFSKTDPQLAGFNTNNPKTKKIFLNEGTHTVDVEVVNEKTLTYDTIDKKILNTQDWAAPRDTRVAEDVKFKITTSAQFANGVEMKGQFKFQKKYNGAQLNEEIVKGLEIGKTYELEFVSPQSKNIRLRNRGDSIIEMEELDDNDWRDLVISCSKGKFFDISGNKCKFILGAPKGKNQVKKIGDVEYSGPEVFRFNHERWSSFLNKNNMSPFLPPIDEDNPAIIGFFTYTWTNVDFVEDGQYSILFQGDNGGSVFINGQLVATNKGFIGEPTPEFVNLKAGKYTVRVEMENVRNERDLFLTNPTGFALKINKKIKVPGDSKPWAENPIGISAVLIAPPCPRRIDGRGIVTDIIVEEPGNGYIRPTTGPEGYPVLLKLKEVLVKDPGINYNCGVDQITITPSNGAELEYECDTFGRIARVKVVNPGMGFTEQPIIRMDSPNSEPTGINFEAVPLFEVVRDPVEALTGAVPLDKLVQVTDLVGLKQTGYVDGRAYYGAVFYKEGVRYAGYYETAGQLIQVYDTLQESIDAQVTTTPSAIQRQGTDTNSNNPRINLPGTPENLI